MAPNRRRVDGGFEGCDDRTEGARPMTRHKQYRVLQERENLPVLRRTVLGHHVQHNHAEENAFLHGEHHHTVHGHLVPHRLDVLFAVGQRRKGKTFILSRVYTSVHGKTAMFVFREISS